VSRLGVEGKIAVVTAGWQEREPEDEELAAHLGGRTVNLRLHARAEELFRGDPELNAAHRERQELLRNKQDFYRIRLEHALDADYVIRKRAAPAGVLAEEGEASVASIRELDAWHLGQCARIHDAFNAKWKLEERPSVARHRAEVARILSECDALAIAGGHVATLVNRLSLFDVGSLVKDKIVFGWSGGAMAISERIVLFHDDPPQGPGASEVLDTGLGLVKGVVVLPQPEQRLRLDRKDRVRVLVQRFAPAVCLAFPARSRVTWRAGRFSTSRSVIKLEADGEHHELQTSRKSDAA
jgi:hypothetical protein